MKTRENPGSHNYQKSSRVPRPKYVLMTREEVMKAPACPPFGEKNGYPPVSISAACATEKDFEIFNRWAEEKGLVKKYSFNYDLEYEYALKCLRDSWPSGSTRIQFGHTVRCFPILYLLLSHQILITNVQILYQHPLALSRSLVFPDARQSLLSL